MKLTIVLLIGLLLLAGCGNSTPVQQCDYKPFLEQNTNLITQNTQCQAEKTTCSIALAESKAMNNVLKLQILNPNTTTDCVKTDCNTVVRLLSEKEEALEDCWFNSNATIVNETTVWHNSTMANALANCTQMLNIINETLND